METREQILSDIADLRQIAKRNGIAIPPVKRTPVTPATATETTRVTETSRTNTDLTRLLDGNKATGATAQTRDSLTGIFSK